MSETNSLMQKLPEHYHWIDCNTMNVFYEGIGVGTLKYATGFNHSSWRDKKIKNSLIDNHCLQCSQKETQEYVILCKEV